MALSVLFSAANIGICIAEIAVHTAKITDSHRLFINDPPPMLSAACAFYSINALFHKCAISLQKGVLFCKTTCEDSLLKKTAFQFSHRILDDKTDCSVWEICLFYNL